MAIKYSIEQHAEAYPSDCLATNYGRHIFNITLLEDTDNGFFCSLGDFIELDNYKEAAAGACTGKVIAQAANGNYYVQIKTCDEGTLFVYQVPMIEEEYNNTFKKESNFYNKSGDVVRAYQLAPNDRIEISAAGFAAEPSVGDEVSLATITGYTYAKQFA